MSIAELTYLRKTTKAFDPAFRLTDQELSGIRSLLRMSPSSTNAQPWHFFLATSEVGKRRVAAGVTGDFSYNEAKIMNAAAVIVLCARHQLDDAYLRQVLAQETKDGRLMTEAAQANQHKIRLGYVQKHGKQPDGVLQWAAKQVYIALGFVLLGAAEMGVDACPIEGFDAVALDQALGLEAKGLRSQVIVALGRSAPEDFNAGLPKSRLPESAVITEL
jgi:nitroreductase / dihydropteridine reductase